MVGGHSIGIQIHVTKLFESLPLSLWKTFDDLCRIKSQFPILIAHICSPGRNLPTEAKPPAAASTNILALPHINPRPAELISSTILP